MMSLRWRVTAFLMRYSDPFLHLHHAVMRMAYRPQAVKVFCIGPAKTGTTSLYMALKTLGFRTVRMFKIGEMTRLDLTKEDIARDGWSQFIGWMQGFSYDAYVDFPLGWFDAYVHLDRAFPGSKFILTTRDQTSYAVSFSHHFEGSFLKGEEFSEERLSLRLRQIEERNKAVQDYFRDRPGQLLCLDVIGGEGWEKLCPFLGKPIPDEPFPRRNVGRYHRRKK
jgi:hypothetical protein